MEHLSPRQHLSEAQLVLYHYGEAVDGAGADRTGIERTDMHRAVIDRATVEQHLAGCPACRTSYQALQDVLAAVDAAPVPERLDAYGAMVWNRLQPRLLRQRGSRWSGLFEWRRWAVAGAMALLLAAAFLAGRFSPRPTAPTVASGQVRERILLVAVGDHLDRSQLVLVELANAKSNGSLDISTEQERAEDLLDANRLYRQTAASAGETGLANVLDDLERTLLEIAHSPSKLSSQELEDIRRRIESEGILFKIRVIGSKVRAREEEAQRAPGRGRL